MLAKSHDQKVQEQIRQYLNTENMHGALPPIFRYWQEQYFKPRFSKIFGANNHLEFYWKAMAKRIRTTGCKAVMSLGSGDAQVEVGVAKGLQCDGITDFKFHCVELSPAQIGRAREFVKQAGLTDNFVFIQSDFNSWDAGDQVFVGAMCHHSLHHVQNLENVIGAIRRSLHPDGVFVSIDVIGRNGHMRWPEALEVVNRIWRFLPDDKKFHHIFKTVDSEFRNHDCSTEGFEGIRSQDILQVLINNFSFEAFLAFGNLIDVFTNRAYGANYDPNSDHDRGFVDFVEYINELLIDLGHIKPTRMCSVMVLDRNVRPQVWKNWTPEFCLRQPD